MQPYRTRQPRASPLWQCLTRHFDTFLDTYEVRYQSRYGFLRPIIPEVVNKFFDCGDLAHGFARIRCDTCDHEYLLAFSCKGRWFCPSCHQKKVQLFGALLTGTVLPAVPHRHFTFTIPKMLRLYFRHERFLLKTLCRIAQECLAGYLREVLALPDGVPAAVLVIHTFGEYLDFHPHLHALVADGLFRRDGAFLAAPAADLAPLEALFRARVIAFLLGANLLPPARARMLRGWTHSGFHIHRSRRVEPAERDDLSRLAQYIIRNPFSLQKMQVMNANRANPAGAVLYRSGMNHKIQRNFEVFTPCDFIAAITQHIPDKNFQLVRYYGWYSNKMRGQRAKQAAATVPPGAPPVILDPPPRRRIPSPKWRELIKKVWEADPLLCPKCAKEMRIVSLIDDRAVIERILRHLGLWPPPAVNPTARGPPAPADWIVEPCLDDFPPPDDEPVFLSANE